MVITLFRKPMNETFRHYANDSLFGIEVHKHIIHTTAEKAVKRFTILHGDDFDSATRYNKLIGIAGRWDMIFYYF